MIRAVQVVFGIILLFAGQSYPQGVVYFSESETDLSGNRVPFYPGGTIIGDIRSNDAFTFAKPVPTIKGRVLTSSGGLQLEDNLTVDDLHLPMAPLLKVAPLSAIANIGRTIRNNGRFIPTDNGKMMVRLVFRGDYGCEVWKWPRGNDPDQYAKRDETIGGLWCSAIFVDGECEVEGIVSGNVTVGAAGDIYIRDNIQYVGSNAFHGGFGEDYLTQRTMKHSLGIVSEKNIIIQNNMKNGSNDGARRFPNDINRHSVNINAALWALGGSLMFEQTNDSTELYQGPSPDERGTVYITGQIRQAKAFPLHNNNHGGTGYKVKLTYDYRFWSSPPPYNYDRNYPPILFGYYENQQPIDCWFDTHIISHCNLGVLYATCDTLAFQGPYTLEIREGRTFRGYGNRYKPDSTIYIHYPYWKPGVPKAKIICRNAGAEIEFRNVVIGAGVELEITSMYPLFENSEAQDNATFTCRDITLDNCKFANLNLNCWEDATLTRNLIRGTLTVDNLPDNCLIRNNTILAGGGDGIVIDSYKKIDIRNNIITGAKRGLVDSYKRKGITLGYNCLWDCKETDIGISDLGEGNVFADPRFYDARNDIYELAVGSPCYNAGDPKSPKDPDGTRADMGAYYCAQTAVDDDPVAFLTPSEPVVTISPNPFNATTRIRFDLLVPGTVRVELFDLSGRRVQLLRDGWCPTGRHEVVWNGQSAGGVPVPSGEYLVRISTDGWSTAQRLLLIR